jgi:hypothetical protein
LAVPQREPLSAPLLGALLALAGLVAGWLVLATDVFAQAGAGLLAGFPWQGAVLEPPFGLPAVRQSVASPSGVWASAAILLAGPVATLVVGSAFHLLTGGFRAPAWLRAVGFEMFAVACLRFPILFLAAGVHGGRGQLAALYERLGEPESGRWAAIALGAVVLWGAATLVSSRALALAREWLRIDGRTFRRRAVRLVATYPALVALGAYAVQSPLVPAVWLAACLVLLAAALELMVR